MRKPTAKERLIAIGRHKILTLTVEQLSERTGFCTWTLRTALRHLGWRHANSRPGFSVIQALGRERVARMTVAQIAEITGTSAESVRSLLRRHRWVWFDGRSRSTAWKTFAAGDGTKDVRGGG